jgi:tricorn protease
MKTLRLTRALITAAALITVASAQTKLLRFPDIHANQVAFTYGGDLWTAPASGGSATRLTSHPGIEVFAKFSPDGKWIAFTGQYDGDEQVYVVPATGGVPKQLTWYPARGPLPPRWGYDNQVYGWTNDGSRVVFRSLRDGWFPGYSRLYSVSLEGGPAEALPMPMSGAGEFSPAGNKLVYSPMARDFRTEKRYSGGQANQLYIFDTETFESKKISDSPRASRDPMWIGNAIYFNSDRDGHFNLYSYDIGSGKTTQLTKNNVYDVRWPSSDRDRRIVYELNGELQIFDVKAQKSTPISINVPDEGLNRRASRVPAAGLTEGAALSPKGERVLFAARGDIFTAPVEKGPTRNLTHSSDAHDKNPRWSPDGSKVLFISDKSGEEELWVVAQDGSKPAEQLTTGGKAFRYQPEWAPDGKRIAFSDKNGSLWIFTVDDKKLTEIAKSRRGGGGTIRDYEWSRAGNHLAFSMPNENGYSSVHIWSARDNQVRRVTSTYFNANTPSWDPEGTYLFFQSDHEFAPLISSVEFNYATNRTTGLYAMSLRKDVKHPFPPESDEVKIDPPKPSDTPAANDPPKTEPRPQGSGLAPAKPDAAKPDAPKPEPPKDLVIDFDNIESRVARVPVDFNNYAGLEVKSGHMVYSIFPPFYYGRQADTKSSLRIYSLKDRKETTLLEDIQGWSLSFDKSKLLVRQGPGWTIMDATPTGAAGKKTVSTAGLFVDRVPEQEWTNIFNEVWRRYRDFFYVPNMHGYDWEKVRKQYEPLLKHVSHRSDLNYVLSEMISELTVQHAYIDGGDMQTPPRPRVALPGARFTLDKAAGRYKISKIFEGQNEEDIYRSPLTEIGVDAKAGDYVLAINGEELTGKDDPYRLLKNIADNPVALLVNSTPTTTGARTVTFRPITDESKLIYLDWVATNRRMVDKLSGGRLGYIHVPDMGADGIREFIKWYYPQIRKEGLVVDVRANGGGNVSRMLIQRLSERPLAAQISRNSQDPNLYPNAFNGPMVALLNENSSSDGDIFPAMFREAKLGPLIGKRSWGGTIGITNHGMLIDGGQVNVPEFGFANLKGEWIIEGYGVDPDIEVENDPRSVFQGKDPQLERGVAELMAKLKAAAPAKVVRPPDPVKLK